MRKNLTTKTIVIFAVLIFFVFGIIGIPRGVTGPALKASILDRIHLGLDLRGGTHLILQVMVDEAVGIATDSDAAHIKQDLQQNGITVGVGDQARSQSSRRRSRFPVLRPIACGDIRTRAQLQVRHAVRHRSGANNPGL